MKNNKPNDPKAIAGGCTIMLLIIVVIFFSLKSCFFSSEESSDVEEFKPTKITALIMSRDFIKQRLKSPSSAEFDESIDGILQLNNYVFMVSSFVDSQNSFGAMIRSNYKCKITFDRKGNAYCDEVVLLE